MIKILMERKSQMVLGIEIMHIYWILLMAIILLFGIYMVYKLING